MHEISSRLSTAPLETIIRLLEHWQTHLLDVIIAQSPSILKLLARENEPLLVRRDALLVLDLGFDVVDRVARFHLEGDGLAREGLDETFVSLLDISAPFFGGVHERGRGEEHTSALFVGEEY